METIKASLKSVKQTKTDPNLSNFETDKAKIIYILITRLAKTVCFVATLILLPSIIVDFVVEYILFS